MLIFKEQVYMWEKQTHFFVTQYAHPKDILYVSIFYVKNLH